MKVKNASENVLVVCCCCTDPIHTFKEIALRFLICSRCPLWFLVKGLRKNGSDRVISKDMSSVLKKKLGTRTWIQTQIEADANRTAAPKVRKRETLKRKFQSVTTCFCSFEQLRHHCTDVFEHAERRYNKARREQVENVSANVIITHFNKRKYDSKWQEQQVGVNL